MKKKAVDKLYSLYTLVAGYLFVSYLETQMAMCDIFGDIETISNNIVSRVVQVATAILPVVFVITLLCIIFTRDQKKLAQEYTILISSAVAFIALLVIQKGNLAETLQGLTAN